MKTIFEPFSHIDYVVEVCAEVYKQRRNLRGLKMVNSPPYLRHFTARFDEI